MSVAFCSGFSPVVLLLNSTMYLVIIIVLGNRISVSFRCYCAVRTIYLTIYTKAADQYTLSGPHYRVLPPLSVSYVPERGRWSAPSHGFSTFFSDDLNPRKKYYERINNNNPAFPPKFLAVIHHIVHSSVIRAKEDVRPTYMIEYNIYMF